MPEQLRSRTEILLESGGYRYDWRSIDQAVQALIDQTRELNPR